MRRFVFLISILSCIGIAGCGSLVDQRPEQQAVADAVHQNIMDRAKRYRTEAGVKVMASCVAWKDQESVRLSGFSWYYYETRYAMRGRSVPKLKQAAIGDCQGEADNEEPVCACQVIDVNGRNAIVVPNEFTNSSLRVEYSRSQTQERTRPQTTPSAPATALEKLERRAVNAGASSSELPSTQGQTLPQITPPAPATPQKKLESRAGRTEAIW